MSSVPSQLPLPTGTVTFPFTDIEGSTRLVQALGADRWGPLLERHREIVRTALAASDGIEIQTEGDAFFAVFARPADAIRAVVAAQRGLAAEPWPEDAPVRVRMGLHTGDGELDADGAYVGADVHRAARVGGAGHGGQVVLSAATAALLSTSLPDGVALRDLGEHRLKDLRPERLWQLDADGLPHDFPAVRSLDARPNNLPTQLTSFVGRHRELAETGALLRGTRLLTLTGPGGTGKTRLSLQLAAAAADAYPAGTWFVPLEPIRDPTLVLPTIARTLGIAERAERTPLDMLTETIGEDRILFVLDNFEQVIDAAPDVAALLRACPGIAVITTSRAVLRVSGEQEYVVPGLPSPPDTSRLSRVELENLPPAVRRPDAATLCQYEAVRLFIARAVAVRPGFQVTNDNAPAVAAICARLQGMPLAIELAAARVRILSPEQILARLEDQLALLTSTARDLPERQRTLRGAIAWSCDLLDEPHRRLLARLSVFRGGWDLGMAEAVLDAGDGTGSEGPGLDILEGLTTLVDQSLARSVDIGDEPRFDLLESIREFAAELLAEAGVTEVVRERHAGAFLALAEEAAPHLSGEDQRAWLERLERDHDNLRAALSWAVERPDPEVAVRLAFALWRFWQQRGYLREARRELEELAAVGWELSPVLRARLAEAAGGVAYWQADLDAAAHWYDDALAEWERLGDEREIANALYNRGYIEVASMQTIMAEKDSEEARRLCQEQAADARRRFDLALTIYRGIGDRVGEANVLWGLGGLEAFLGDQVAAEPWFRRSLELHLAAGHRTMEAWSLHMLSLALVDQRRLDEALEMSRQALRLFHRSGDISGITLCLDALAAIALGDDDTARSGRLWGAARALQLASGADLAQWDEGLFETLKDLSPRTRIPGDELERLAAEGRAMALDETVAYAMGERPPNATEGPPTA